MKGATQLNKKVDKKLKGKPASFSEMINISFQDPSFKKSFTPILAEMVRPLIQETVNIAVEGIRSTVVADMIKSNESLQQTVKEQSRIIKEQNTIIDKQKSMINDQKILLDSNNETIEQLQCSVHVLEGEIEELKLANNDLEQYGRRNSIRINNMIFDGPSPPADEQSLTLSVLNFINSDILKDVNPLFERDIERCHFVGKPRAGKPQQIIVKFARYHDKWKVFSAKKNLKNHPNKTFITEDLTKLNHAVVQSLLPLKKAKSIDSFWTRDGRIIVKKGSADDPIRISPNDNLNIKLSLDDEAASEAGDDDFA